MILPNPFPGVVAKPTVVTTTTTTTSITTVPTPSYKFKKAGKAGVLISVILDESGSMSGAQDSTIAGFNEYVAGQKAAVATAGAAYLTLNKFDAPKIETVFASRPIDEVPLLTRKTYSPNGGTNLLDAIGYTINQVNDVLAKLKRNERPGVIIVITTDGQENASNKFNAPGVIKAMVAAAEKADWSFIFMGANIDSFSVGSTFGMNAHNTVNYSTANMGGTYSSLGSTTTRMRSAKMAGASTEAVYATSMFTETEKKAME